MTTCCLRVPSAVKLVGSPPTVSERCGIPRSPGRDEDPSPWRLAGLRNAVRSGEPWTAGAMSPAETAASWSRRGWREDMRRLDLAVYAAVGDGRGRGAAADGVCIGLTSAVVNLVLKPLGDRRRPNRDTYAIPVARQVAMPRSTSFPSGHAASAFAFATGVGSAMPALGLPLHGAAAVVACSRVHTGVHYPADVVVGSVTGAALGQVAVALRRRSPLRRGRAR